MSVLRSIAVVACVAVLAGACGPGPASTPAPTPSVAPTSTPTPRPSATSTPFASATTSSPSPSVVVDATLLEHLPVSVGGVDFAADPATADGIAADPTLGRTVSALAVAIAVRGAAADDLAIASVVRVRAGIFDEAFFAEWRASYDAAACAQAGGAGPSVERTIGPYQAFVGTCVGGAKTYHVHLTGDILVSVTATGPRDFGALTVAGLR